MGKNSIKWAENSGILGNLEKGAGNSAKGVKKSIKGTKNSVKG